MSLILFIYLKACFKRFVIDNSTVLQILFNMFNDFCVYASVFYMNTNSLMDVYSVFCSALVVLLQHQFESDITSSKKIIKK